MDRFISLDATAQTLSAHLHPDERLLLHQDGVGLYDGKDKSPPHYDGRLHLTSHRLIFLSSTTPHSASVALDLSLVKQTEYWTGFLKSNPKITLLLAPTPTPSTPSGSNAAATTAGTDDSSSPAAGATTAGGGSRNWICRVCGMKNLPSSLLGAKCSLCGVARDRPSSSSSSTSTPLPPSPLPSRTATPRLDRDQYSYSSRSATPPPLPPPPPSKPEPPAPPPTTTTDRRLPCPVCTFLNHHSMSSCEVCDSPLVLQSTTSTPPSLSRSSTPIAEPTSNGGATFVRLSFRKGGERAFYTSLKETLGRKEWEWDGGKNGSAKARGGGAAGNSGEGGGGGGIDAIMRTLDLDTRERDDELDDALKDLNALMGKAKEMILLAQSMNERLSTSTPAPNLSSSTTPAPSNLATTSLLSLGLVSAPITSDQLDSEEKYHHELAKELGKVLVGGGSGAGAGGLMERRGVIGLDEVWCLWNRARGVSLIPPSALSSSAPHLPLYTSPKIHPHTFPSGLTILHTPFYSTRAFSSRVLDLLDLRQALALSGAEAEGEEGVVREGATTLEVVKAEMDAGRGGGVGVALVKEMLEEVEQRGELVRDEQGGEGVRWFRNLMSGVGWDGEVF